MKDFLVGILVGLFCGIVLTLSCIQFNQQAKWDKQEDEEFQREMKKVFKS